MVESAEKPDDSGFTLVEVIIAMMVFALIALGVGYSTITTLRMAADTRAREVAANLASGEIDSVRAAADPFTVYDATRSVSVGGTTYTIARDAGWVSATGTTGGCGTGTGNLQYKRVNVAVSWTSQLTSTPAAHADTLLAPNTRLTDPHYGSVLVSVLGVDGTGASGVSVSVTPQGGGSPLTQPVAATDMDGCTYAFKVAPGTYSVSIFRSASVDVDQQTSPAQTISVQAGQSSSAAFQYDYSGTLTVAYGPDTAPARILPSNLVSTYFSSYGMSRVPGTPGSVALHPIPSGYTAVAGGYVAAGDSSAGCLSVDSGAWTAGTVGGKALAAGSRAPAVAAPPAGASTSPVRVPMGALVVTAAAGASDVRVISAAAPVGTGDPGCSVPQTFTYTVPASGSYTLAVPFGSWTVEEFTGGVWKPVPAARCTVPTNAAGPTVTGAVVTVDPRKLA
ncbi:MAG: prepilin-type N-terminal cleavage/methylation protein [Naasia sp.]|uniref:type IV pilus modification PilV family protein n=1 Tax=Naasia sp. TaxID=2546198 RepID=UPI00262CF219|nr:type II secretion system protein [Naasia sp.]MCU1570082.1 prepilin-type N-terminal cleavage/methylation protein [Naasia sp.]